jgi:hypothetical protein
MTSFTTIDASDLGDVSGGAPAATGDRCDMFFDQAAADIRKALRHQKRSGTPDPHLLSGMTLATVGGACELELRGN